MKPLAYALRPTKIDDIYGQLHLVGPNGVIRKMIANNQLQSMIFYGNPGIGKTTLALCICNELNIPYEQFNASNDNKARLKEIIDKALEYDRFVLIVDEIHRMKRDIQDYLLGFVEKGDVILIGLTTINPYHSVNPAVRSRTIIYKLNDLSNEDLGRLLVDSLKKIDSDLQITDEAKEYIIQMANGEVRYILNILEALTNTSNNKLIDLHLAKQIIQKPSINIDKNTDNYFDTLSGLQKSIRGSDVDASIHYLAKLLVMDDLPSLVRRLQVIAYEDIGLANPSIGPRVRAACEAALDLGMPEARIPLASVVCDMALSPKSNSTILAIDAALADIEAGKSGNLPLHLKNQYSFDPSQGKYKYPHDFPGHWVDQQYLPDAIKDASYYHPQDTSQYEKMLGERYYAIKKAKENNKK